MSGFRRSTESFAGGSSEANPAVLFHYQFPQGGTDRGMTLMRCRTPACNLLHEVAVNPYRHAVEDDERIWPANRAPGWNGIHAIRKVNDQDEGIDGVEHIPAIHRRDSGEGLGSYN